MPSSIADVLEVRSGWERYIMYLMQLPEFLRRNDINISNEYYDLCCEGIEIMEKSVDINHDENHVFQILSELDQFLRYETTISKDIIDFEILLPAICWHDVWHSKRKLAQSVPILFIEEIYEGVGSFIIFKRHVNKMKNNLKKTDRIAKSILLHPDYKFLPFTNSLRNVLYSRLEFLILTDLDNLDAISAQRIETLSNRYKKRGKTDPLLFRVGYFWVKKMVISKKSDSFHFPYTKERFKEKNIIAIKKMVKILNDLMSNKEYWFDSESPKYKYVKDFQPTESDLKLMMQYTTP